MYRTLTHIAAKNRPNVKKGAFSGKVIKKTVVNNSEPIDFIGVYFSNTVCGAQIR
jgi:hypothetical protein